MQKIGVFITVGALCILSCDSVCAAKSGLESYGNIAKIESVFNGNTTESDLIFSENAVFTRLEQYSNAAKIESIGNRNKAKTDLVFSENAAEIKSEAIEDAANIGSKVNGNAANIKLEANEDIANNESETIEDAANNESEAIEDAANNESESNGNTVETAAADLETQANTEVIQENDTSVIIPMNHAYAAQLSVSDVRMANSSNDYKSLKLPSQITRQGDYYFIVDTYNDQVLYVSDMWKPISEWRVMDRRFNRPHAIASDGKVYLVVDTDNDRVLCYEYINGRFQNTQQFCDVGIRPHYIQYDAITESFFVWSSLTGDMYIMKREPGSNRMYIEEIRHIYELDGFYVRSFSIEGDEILFPSGNNGYMIVADKDTLRVKNRYPVPMEISGMAFAKKIGNDYYITVSTDENYNHDKARMIRTSDLDSLSLGLYENITGYFKDMRIPYYIDRINSSYCVTNHEGKKFVYMFNVSGDVIKDVQTIH